MWLFLGILTIVFTILNLIWSFQNKNAKWFRFAGLALTALTMCSFYSDGAMRVAKEDWGGLMDIMPTIHALPCVENVSLLEGGEDDGE